MKIIATVDLEDMYAGNEYYTETVSSVIKNRLSDEIHKAVRDVLREEVRKSVQKALREQDKVVQALIQEARDETLKAKKTLLEKQLKTLK